MIIFKTNEKKVLEPFSFSSSVYIQVCQTKAITIFETNRELRKHFSGLDRGAQF